MANYCTVILTNYFLTGFFISISEKLCLSEIEEGDVLWEGTPTIIMEYINSLWRSWGIWKQ